MPDTTPDTQPDPPNAFSMFVATEEGYEHLPTPMAPYYTHFAEGIFLHRHTQLGNVLLPAYGVKPDIPKLGYPKGLFVWDRDTIPATIISQATDFFRRIYDKHHTEAEVLLTMHNETKAFRIFVPYQVANGAGVRSVHEPTHISTDYTVVGTIHSHCHFSAFHSGTDHADATDMDGVHLTIGMLQNDPPEIVAMVAMGKQMFHYQNVSDVADLDFHADTAPAWWDNFVYNAGVPSEKPKALKSLTQHQWDQFRGTVGRQQNHQPKPKHGNKGGNVGQYGKPGQYRGSPGTWRADQQPPNTEFDFQRWRDQGNHQRWTPPAPIVNPAPQVRWGAEGQLIWVRNANNVWTHRQITPAERRVDDAIDKAIAAKVISATEWMDMDGDDTYNAEAWASLLAKKALAMYEVLDELGYQMDYNIIPKTSSTPGAAPAETPTTPEPTMTGTTTDGQLVVFTETLE